MSGIIDKVANIFRRSAGGTNKEDFGEQVRNCCRMLLGSRNCGRPDDLSAEAEAKAQDWYARCEQLFQEAERMGRAGEVRGGYVFDSLKKRSLALADEWFDGVERGCVFVRVAQIFDKNCALAKCEAEAEEPSAPPPPPPPSPTKATIVVSGVGSSAGGSGEVWTPYPRLPTDEFRALVEVQKIASWSPPSVEGLNQAKSRFAEKYPDDANLLPIAEANGHLLLKVRDAAFSDGASGASKSGLSERLFRMGIPKYLHELVQDSFNKGRKSALRREGLPAGFSSIRLRI